MDETTKKFDDLFYDYLRKSQPLAFLASFSMIIAVFAHSNKDIPNSVYTDAATAGMMFIISFITSMLGQLAHENDVRNKEIRPSTGSEALRYGTYFLFGIGVIYLLLIANDFSKSLQSIPQIVNGWFELFIGLTLAVLLKTTLRKYNEKKEKPLMVGIIIGSFVIMIFSSFVPGLADVFGAFLNLHLDENIHHYFTYALLAPLPLLVLATLVWTKKKSIKSNGKI